MFWIMKTGFFVTCIIISLGYEAFAAPLGADKSGEEQVKDAVRKAEAAASLAAEDSISHGHKAEERVAEDKVSKLASEIEDDSSMKEGHAAKKVNLMKHLDKKDRDSDDESENFVMKRVKEHRVHGKPSLSHLMGMTELGDVSSNTNSYKEDTKLEDRLAIEAEEEKKYEDGYGGGGQGWEDGPAGNSKGSWSTNIQKQDAAEKQSIQAQVASESAHELNEIQQAVAAESQSSRGSATMGDQGPTVVQVGNNEAQTARFRQEETQRPMEAGASFENPRIKSFESNGHQQNVFAGLESPSMPYHQQDLSSIIRQASKLSPSEMQGPPKQYSSEGMGSMNGLSMDSNGQGQGMSRFTQSESAGSQEASPMMSNAFTGGAEGTQMNTGAFQESDPSQRDSGFTTGGGGGGGGGGYQGGAGMEVGGMQGGMQGGSPIEMGGGNSMGSLSAGFAGAQQQQQPLMAGAQQPQQSFMAGGQAGAAVMGGMPSMQAAGASMGGLPQFGGMGGMQSFGGQMGFKKRSKTAKVEKEDQQKAERHEKARNSKKSKLAGHHNNHHHHHHHHHHHKKHY